MSEEKSENRIQIVRQKQKSKYFTENLGNGISLEMVLIPDGTFLMGSPEDELERRQPESPQHEVSLQPFFIGRYPVTQGQWKAIVETTEKIERDLNLDPSDFKKAYEDYERWSRPVERVSWYRGGGAAPGTSVQGFVVLPIAATVVRASSSSIALVFGLSVHSRTLPSS
ncbi:MAG: formylglycine-generating enzyme family protein [Cyanobacteriota bacterium]|nr:formylglycine-generating enzyme family protein [Cyanobacteriota bacterium]